MDHTENTGITTGNIAEANPANEPKGKGKAADPTTQDVSMDEDEDDDSDEEETGAEDEVCIQSLSPNWKHKQILKAAIVYHIHWTNLLTSDSHKMRVCEISHRSQLRSLCRGPFSIILTCSSCKISFSLPRLTYTLSQVVGGGTTYKRLS